MISVSVRPMLRMDSLRTYFQARRDARTQEVRENSKTSTGLASDPRAYGNLASALMAPVGVVAR